LAPWVVAEPSHEGNQWFSAVRNGNEPLVTRLLSRSPKLADKLTSSGWTALHFAAFNGHDQIVAKLLFAGGKLYPLQFNNYLALIYAAFNGHDQTVARLLDAGFDCSVSLEHRTALHSAAFNGHERVVEHLLASNPNLGLTADSFGRTPLHYAARWGHAGVVAQLLAVHPSSAHDTDINGWTPLFFAVQYAQMNVFERLLVNCALDTADRHGLTALLVAAESGHETLVARLHAENSQLIRAKTLGGWTALQCASWNGHDKVIRLLVDLAPELIEDAECHTSALHYAIYRGHESVAEQLIALKPESVFSIDERGCTLLHIAARVCSEEFIAKLWAMNPAALRHVSKARLATPFEYVITSNRARVIELFQWSLSIDEIASYFTSCNVGYVERYRPIIEAQCKCLHDALLRDIVRVVFEYLGF